MVILGGSWVVISGVISRATKVITHLRGLFSLLIIIATHEPPSSPSLSPNPSSKTQPQKSALVAALASARGAP